jgi:hypothetical protein
MLYLGKGSLTMGYFDNIYNGLLKKYEKILKIIISYRYILLLID